MGVFPLVSDGQVDFGYDPYCIFEICKQEWSICYRRHRDTLLRVRLGAQKFELAIVTGGRSGGSSMRY